MKKSIFIFLYIVISLILILNKFSFGVITNKEEIQNQYEKYYKLKLNGINFKIILDELKNQKVKIIEIKPTTYKNIDKSFNVNKNNINEIYNDFIEEYTNILNEKGYTEESLYIKEKGIALDYIKLRTKQENIDKLKNKYNFSYSIESNLRI